MTSCVAELNTTQHPNACDSLLKFSGFLSGIPVTVLVDGGSTNNFVSAQLVSKHNLKTSSISEYGVRLADGSRSACVSMLRKAPLKIGRYRDRLCLSVIPLEGCDIVLGKAWFTHFNPVIDWRSNAVQFAFRGERVVLGPDAT